MNAYIGKKLRLISKSDIRYEGVVYSLDATDSSLTLTQGTWGLHNSGSREFHTFVTIAAFRGLRILLLGP